MAATPPAFLNRQPLALYEAPRRLPLALDTRKGRIAMGSVRSRLVTPPWTTRGTAERDQAGMWSGAFVTPWEWRHRKDMKDLRRRIERAMEDIERDRI